MTLKDRLARAEAITRTAGALALTHFNRPDGLRIDEKGRQDFVTEADREVEKLIRAALAEAFPEDGILGEEDGLSPGTSGGTWVCDPIDGTANFAHGIALWCVVLAYVEGGDTVLSVTFDPVRDECFTALKGQGAWLNGAPMARVAAGDFHKGSIGIGLSGRTSPAKTSRIVQGILEDGGVFVRNASGAISLAYVAAGRLLGYTEYHMNPWDCLAGRLLVAEAGGRVEYIDTDQMLKRGGRMIVAAPGVFDRLLALSEAAYQD